MPGSRYVEVFALKFLIEHDHPCLPGHFPGRPLVPGVLVLDRVYAAIEAAQGAPLSASRLPQVKFLQPLLPGEDATVELDASGAPRWRFRVLRADGGLVASGEVVAGTVDGRAAGAA